MPVEKDVPLFQTSMSQSGIADAMGIGNVEPRCLIGGAISNEGVFWNERADRSARSTRTTDRGVASARMRQRRDRQPA